MQQSMTLGQAIQAARLSCGLTLQQLAEAVGVNRTSILRFESGARSPRASTLRRIAATLDTPAADLFALSGFTVPTELPTLRPYLRAKYGLDEQTITAIGDYIAQLANRYGQASPGPEDGEDEFDT